jgi:hypothetical protein
MKKTNIKDFPFENKEFIDIIGLEVKPKVKL